MSTEIDGGYDIGYRAVTGFWGTKPSSLVAQYLESHDVRGLKVLDAGAGEGKNAAAFARLGASVDAIECSAVAIDNGRTLYDDAYIDWVHSDITTLPLPLEYYDVVICYGLIHCLGSEKVASDTVESLRSALKSGGVFILCSFNDGSHELSAHPGFKPLLLSHNWFKDKFSDWRVEQISDSLLFETHPHNNIPHHHSISRILAVKT